MAFAIRQKMPCATRPRPSEATGPAKWADSSRKWPIFCGVFMFLWNTLDFEPLPNLVSWEAKVISIISLYWTFFKLHEDPQVTMVFTDQITDHYGNGLGKQVSKTRSPRFRFHVVDVLMPMNRHRAQGRIDVFLRFNKKLKRFLFGYFGTVSMCRWTISEEISGSFGLGQQWWFLIL